MKALVFAAGIGSRLKPFTDRHPKALAPVSGIPMLQRVLEKLLDAGIRDIVVNVHHFPDQIIDFLTSNGNFGGNISISDERTRLLDTGGGLLKAKNLLTDAGNPEDPILLHNADILTDAPVDEMLAWHRQTKADVTLLTDHRLSSRQLYFDNASHRLCGWSNLKTGECRPASFRPDPDLFDAMAFGGVHIINPTVFTTLEQYAEVCGPVFSITPFYIQNASALKITGYTPAEQFSWHDIGSPAKLDMAERAMASQSR